MKKILTKGSTCPHCKKGKLIIIPDDEPWSVEHLYCPKCDSTYCIGDKDETKICI